MGWFLSRGGITLSFVKWCYSVCLPCAITWIGRELRSQSWMKMVFRERMSFAEVSEYATFRLEASYSPY